MLEHPVTVIPMIGEHRKAALAEFDIHTVGTLLEFYPRKYLDRSHIVRIRDLQLTEHEVTVVGRVQYVNRFKTKRGRELLTIGIHDGTGLLECMWFQGVDYWSRHLKDGETVAVSGMLTDPADRKFIHPAVDQFGEDGELEYFNTGRIIPLYHGGMGMRSVGLESRNLHKIFAFALRYANSELNEYLPPDDLIAIGALPRREALQQIHYPESREQLDQAWRRVRYEELFTNQLLFAYRRRMNAMAAGGKAFDNIGPITKKVLQALPFRLTEGQRNVLAEIRKDLERPVPMQRLLQGEVGSGKTTVALLAMAMAADAGFQSAFMAPTELLAEQHAQRIVEPTAAAGLIVKLLKGKQRAAERKDILALVAGGLASIVIGTHALIQDNVAFKHLGLVVVDEQHRFGVEQRSKLRAKGVRPHMLLMSATPIPRSLRLAQMGDLDVSSLRELPGGPRHVTTAIRTELDRPKIYDFVHQEVQNGGRVFIVCPLIDESEKVDTEAAIEHHKRLAGGPLKSLHVGLLHGRMPGDDKLRAIEKFRSGETPVLVATPVIEVGVDVPDATVMIVESAERFGLAALHQLRGRIGRKGQRGFFILIPGARFSLEAQDRLQILVESADGFQIAERDLEIRGAGEFFGTRQSGEFDLRYSNPVRDKELLSVAADRARLLIDSDPELSTYPVLRTRFKARYAHRLDFADAG